MFLNILITTGGYGQHKESQRRKVPREKIKYLFPRAKREVIRHQRGPSIYMEALNEPLVSFANVIIDVGYE